MNNLDLNKYENETFYPISKDKSGEYGIISLNKKEFQTIYEILDNAINTYPISKKSIKYLEKNVEPRLNEINNILWKRKDLPNNFQVEFGKKTKNALLEAANNTKISSLMREKSLPVAEIKQKLKQIKFKK
jgi:hypothetical protein